MKRYLKQTLLLSLLSVAGTVVAQPVPSNKTAERTRVIVTSDGEIDDECSLVRFLLYANEWDIEGLITSSSQYHAHNHNWAGDHWLDPTMAAYTQVYSNLQLHDKRYPSPAYLQARTFLGNVETEGEMEQLTPGSEQIVRVLLDESDQRPVWVQAWGGTNTLGRALKTIEEQHPAKMAAVAAKLRLYLIWEQDNTYQSYIRPHWGKFNIPTIIADQFEALAYRWKQVQPPAMQPYLSAPWMNANILQGHGPLCASYKAHQAGDKGFEAGDFRSEGDSPAFLHTIPTGLRSLESPGWGGWGGRFVQVRDNTWLDPVPEPGYHYPEGRWFGSNGWGRSSLREGTATTTEQRNTYFKPMWRWTDVLQNDFAARADWCVKPYAQANHAPVVKLAHALDLTARPGATLQLSAKGTTDPDGNQLTYTWWQYAEADTYPGTVAVQHPDRPQASFRVPADAAKGQTLHLVCEVTDNGSPCLTRYQRVVVTVR